MISLLRSASFNSRFDSESLMGDPISIYPCCYITEFLLSDCPAIILYSRTFIRIDIDSWEDFFFFGLFWV